MMSKTAIEQFSELREAMLDLFLTICKELKLPELLDWLDSKLTRK